MFRIFDGTPLKIVCDNLKTGVTSHPQKGEIVLNEAYLALGKYYSVAIMPTGIRKPKQKASVEGSVDKIATSVIAKLRNDVFTSSAALNAAIRKAVRELMTSLSGNVPSAAGASLKRKKKSITGSSTRQSRGNRT